MLNPPTLCLCLWIPSQQSRTESKYLSITLWIECTVISNSLLDAFILETGLIGICLIMIIITRYAESRDLCQLCVRTVTHRIPAVSTRRPRYDQATLILIACEWIFHWPPGGHIYMTSPVLFNVLLNRKQFARSTI